MIQATLLLLQLEARRSLVENVFLRMVLEIVEVGEGVVDGVEEGIGSKRIAEK